MIKKANTQLIVNVIKRANASVSYVGYSADIILTSEVTPCDNLITFHSAEIVVISEVTLWDNLVLKLVSGYTSTFLLTTFNAGIVVTRKITSWDKIMIGCY